MNKAEKEGTIFNMVAGKMLEKGSLGDSWRDSNSVLQTAWAKALGLNRAWIIERPRRGLSVRSKGRVRKREKEGEEGRWYGSPGSCSPAPRLQGLQPPDLLPPAFLVLFQAPDLLQEPASLLSQAYNLLISIPVILSPPHQGTPL